MSSKPPQQKIINKLIEFMKLHGKWNDDLLKEIPNSFQKYGDHIVFAEPAFTSNIWIDADFWKFASKLYQVKVIAVVGRIQNDGFRTPRVRLLYGDSTTVNFIDNHIKYSWDIKKSMFCSGNVSERHRIAKLDCQDEIIVDLFAGIGYFTLPYLVHSRAKFLHACEWNPSAVAALKRNLKVNGVSEKCQIHEGDNRKVCPRNVADRVNVGLIPSSEEYWQVACEALVPKGGILYIHQNVSSKLRSTSDCPFCVTITSISNNYDDKWFYPYECYSEKGLVKWKKIDCPIMCKKVEWTIFSFHIVHVINQILGTIHPNSWKVYVKDIFKVKSYAPHIDHLVYTTHCFPC